MSDLVGKFRQLVKSQDLSYHNLPEQLDENGKSTWGYWEDRFWNKIVPAGERIPRADAARIWNAHVRSQLASVPLGAKYSLAEYHQKMSWETIVPEQDWAVAS